MAKWNHDLYYRFREERTQPAIDLSARLRELSPRRIVDLGCGPGNSTAILRSIWPEADIVGVDSSPEMLSAAQKSDKATRWLEADLSQWADKEPFDLVFSNAAIQWLTDHQYVIRRLFDLARPGGTIAVQIPYHYDSPLYRVLLDVSRDKMWTDNMGAARDSLTRQPVEFYCDQLRRHTSDFHVWTTTYQHILSSHEDILEFHRSTGMRPYLAELGEGDTKAFEQKVLEGYRASFRVLPNGSVLFPFRRLFFVGKRPES